MVSPHSVCSEVALITEEELFKGNISIGANGPGSWPGGALTLERGMGMCCGHDPLFSGQSPLPSLPIYRQCAALVTPVFNF